MGRCVGRGAGVLRVLRGRSRVKLLCGLLQVAGGVGFVLAAGLVAVPLGVAVGSILVFAAGFYLEHR